MTEAPYPLRNMQVFIVGADDIAHQLVSASLSPQIRYEYKWIRITTYCYKIRIIWIKENNAYYDKLELEKETVPSLLTPDTSRIGWISGGALLRNE